MNVTPDSSDAPAIRFSTTVQWDVQSAIAALSASAAKGLPDNLLMTLLATAADQETFNRLFEEVFNRYKERVVRWCYKVTKSRDRALDLAQEVFLKAFRSIRTFRGDAQLSTWLYVITRNHCLNSIKKWRNEPNDHAISPQITLVIASDDGTHTALERTQSYQEVYRFLSSILTPMEIRVLTLHYVHELTLPAITRHLMLSNSSGAKAYIVSARRKLKSIAQNYTQHRDKLGAFVGDFTAASRSRAA